MKVCAVSDLHGKLPSIGPCDLLIIAGDICPHITSPGSMRDMSYQASWLDTSFRLWLDNCPAKNIVGVAGNHDFVFERMPGMIPINLRWQYLLRNDVVIDGIKIWGSPDQLPFYNWAYNVEEDKLRLEYDTVPVDTDIIISHGPPFGYGDLTPDGTNAGSKSLMDHIKKCSPQYVITGHIHDAHGIYYPHDVKTIIINASALDEKYRLVNDPLYFDINPK